MGVKGCQVLSYRGLEASRGGKPYKIDIVPSALELRYRLVREQGTGLENHSLRNALGTREVEHSAAGNPGEKPGSNR